MCVERVAAVKTLGRCQRTRRRRNLTMRPDDANVFVNVECEFTDGKKSDFFCFNIYVYIICISKISPHERMTDCLNATLGEMFSK